MYISKSCIRFHLVSLKTLGRVQSFLQCLHLNEAAPMEPLLASELMEFLKVKAENRQVLILKCYLLRGSKGIRKLFTH